MLKQFSSVNRFFYMLIIVLISSGCDLFPKEWPQDAYNQLCNNEGIQVDCNFIEAVSDNETMAQQYVHNLLSTYKNTYPNYADFEKAVANKDQTLDNLRIKEIQRITHNYDLNCICKIITQNSKAIEELKINKPLLFNKLKDNINHALKSEFGSLETFIERACSDWEKTDKILEQIAWESSQPIIQELENQRRFQIEQEKKVQQQYEYLGSLSDILSYNSYYTGDIIIHNKTSRGLYVNIAFYFYGSVWDGWIVAGFKLMPNQRNSIEIPLSPEGYLNQYIYYCAKDLGSTYWSWGDVNNGHSFLTLETDDSYYLPYANKSDMYAKCNLIAKWNNNFKLKDIGSGSTTYTFTLTD